MTTAVVLAGGRGTRMRRREPGVELTPEQRAAAEAGWKALMPIAGRPFLEHTLEAAAAAGVDRVLLVTPAADDSLRRRFEGRSVGREAGAVEIRCLVQPRPRGTADALLCCRNEVGPAPFLVLNSDNYYPVKALVALLAADGPACLGLDVDAVLAGGRSNLDRRRLLAWAMLETDAGGMLVRIAEKPTAAAVAARGARWLASPNGWRFSRDIFAACEAVAPSPRGELELPAAVQLAIDRVGGRIRVLPTSSPILDLACRRDVAAVEALLAATAGAARPS